MQEIHTKDSNDMVEVEFICNKEAKIKKKNMLIKKLMKMLLKQDEYILLLKDENECLNTDLDKLYDINTKLINICKN